MTLIRDIALGNHDSELDAIIETAKARQKDLAAKKARQLKVGDVLTLNSTIRPRYLAGMKVQIVQFNPKRVVVKLLPDNYFPFNSRFYAGQQVTCPPSLFSL